MASAGGGSVVMTGVLYAGIKIKAVGVGELGTLTWESTSISQTALVSGAEPGKVCQAWSYLFDVEAGTPVTLDLAGLVASIPTGDRADTLNDTTVAVAGLYLRHNDAANAGVVTVEPGATNGCSIIAGKLFPKGTLCGFFGDGAILDTAVNVQFSADAGTVPVLLTVVGY